VVTGEPHRARGFRFPAGGGLLGDRYPLGLAVAGDAVRSSDSPRLASYDAASTAVRYVAGSVRAGVLRGEPAPFGAGTGPSVMPGCCSATTVPAGHITPR
jgi:hypothetical protein